MPPSPPTLTVSTPRNIYDDIVTSTSVRVSQMSNRRSIWSVHIAVDQVSFLIGAFGGVAVGYWLQQYDPQNIENVDYIYSRNPNNVFQDFFTNTVSHPLAIIERFFLGGAVYVGVGLLTQSLLNTNKPIICGSLTGLYFSYGNPPSSVIKATVGFAVFAMAVEGLHYMFNG